MRLKPLVGISLGKVETRAEARAERREERVAVKTWSRLKWRVVKREGVL